MRLRVLVGLLAVACTVGCNGQKSGTSANAAKDNGSATGASNPSLSPAQLLVKAQGEINFHETSAAISTLEELAKLDPKHHDGIVKLSTLAKDYGDELSQKGDFKQAGMYYEKSAKYMQQLMAANPHLPPLELALLPEVEYKAACAQARVGDTEKALTTLQNAVDAGFNDFAALAREHALDPIRKEAKFQEIVKTAPLRAAAQARAKTRAELAAFKSFNFDFSLKDLDGKVVTRKDFAGKVLIADIWGTWCPPCRAEIPHFVELHKKYQPTGLEIVGLNYERTKNEADAIKLIRDFIKANHMTYHCVLGDDKTMKQVPGFQGFPTTLFIDRQGKVRQMFVGLRPESELEAVVTYLLEENSQTAAR